MLGYKPRVKETRFGYYNGTEDPTTRMYNALATAEVVTRAATHDGLKHPTLNNSGVASCDRLKFSGLFKSAKYFEALEPFLAENDPPKRIYFADRPIFTGMGKRIWSNLRDIFKNPDAEYNQEQPQWLSPLATGQNVWGEVGNTIPKSKRQGEIDHHSRDVNALKKNPEIQTTWAALREHVKAEANILATGVIMGYLERKGFGNDPLFQQLLISTSSYKERPQFDEFWNTNYSELQVFRKGVEIGRKWSPEAVAKSQLGFGNNESIEGNWWNAPPNAEYYTRTQKLDGLKRNDRQEMTYYDLSRAIYQHYKPLLRCMFEMDQFTGLINKAHNNEDGKRERKERNNRSPEEVEQMWKPRGTITKVLNREHPDLAQALLDSKDSYLLNARGAEGNTLLAR